MARVTGPSLARLDDEGDRYADLVAQTIRVVMRRVASDISEHSSEQDLALIRHRWAQLVDSLLLPELGKVWQGAADDVHDQLNRAADRVDRERNGERNAK